MALEILFLIFLLLLCITGLVGCIIPGLPGHPLNFAAMLIAQWRYSTFESSTLIIFGILTVIILVIDFLLPVWFAKKFGATKQGIWGSILGMIAGIFFSPVGMILGMLAGAIIGDMLAGRNANQASKSGIATFLGTLFSVGLKAGLALIMTFMVLTEGIRSIS